MLLALILLSLFFTMLLFPETVFQGACDGLLLWYQILIPTLFPYLIVTGLLLKTDGALAAAVVDYSSGMLLAGGGTSSVDLEIAAAGNTEVVRAKMKTMGMLGLNDIIDDILITLGEQYHLLRPLQKHDGLFLVPCIGQEQI